jgi:hypothetical protein
MPAFELYSIFCSVARLQSVFFGERSFLLAAGVSPKGDRTVGHTSLAAALTLNLLQTAPSASSVLKTLLQAD